MGTKKLAQPEVGVPDLYRRFLEAGEPASVLLAGQAATVGLPERPTRVARRLVGGLPSVRPADLEAVARSLVDLEHVLAPSRKG